MFLTFDKEAMFFINDEIRGKEEFFLQEDSKKLLNNNTISQFLSELQFIIYYIDLSQCNNIVYIESDCKHKNLIKKLFPQINFYFEYEEDLKTLNDNDHNYAIISNIDIEDMNFQENIIKRYQPYAALLDFKFNNYNREYRYLDGLLLKKLFCNKLSEIKLVVRGVGYRFWNIDNIKNNIINFQKQKIKNKFLNPISNDNKTIYKERGLYNTFDETSMTIIIMDYLIKLNQKNNFNNTIKLLIYILDNLIEEKSINFDIEYIMG